MKIPYAKPSITDLEIRYVDDAIKHGWGDSCYDYIKKFEIKFAEYIGVKYAVATSSCTGALTLGLSALNIGCDDEVILADTNWVATVAPIVQLGAKPVFVDIDPVNWCINPSEIEKKITSKTRAIIATHLYGNLADMNSLINICEEYDIILVEDAAEALGSEYHCKKAGSLGKFGVFSFHGSKSLTTGEGGMLVTNDRLLYERVLQLNNHGRGLYQDKQFWCDEIGYKFKISNIQSALGLAQLMRIDELVERKRNILLFYKKSFSEIGGISMNYEANNCRIGAWMPNVVFDRQLGITREKLLEEFRRKEIDARVFFWPLSSLKMFEDCPENFNSRDIASRSINLPSYFDIEQNELQAVVTVIQDLLGNQQ